MRRIGRNEPIVILTRGSRGRTTTGGGTITGGIGMGVTTGGVGGTTTGGVEGSGAGISAEPGVGIVTGGFAGSGAGINVELGRVGNPAGPTRGTLLKFAGGREGFALATGPDDRKGFFLVFCAVLRRPLAGFAISVDCSSPTNSKVATKNKTNS